MSIEYRQLGASGLRVSTLTLGTMTFGGTGWAHAVGQVDIDGVRRQIDRARAAGVNLIDTADIYSDGLSEELVGRALDADRDEILIATKLRLPTGSAPNDVGLSRHHIIRSAEASLRRLRTDHIDLYQVHGWDGATPLEETLRALDDLVTAGKVRYIGASNYTGWQLMKALGTSERHGYHRFVSHQIYYSVKDRDAEMELVPAAVDQGLGLLVWSPLAGGLLSGKYRRDAPQPDGTRRLQGWDQPKVGDEKRFFDIVEVLSTIGGEHETSAARVALAYLLRKPAITSLVIGARTDEQLADNLAAVDLDLSDADMARLDEVSELPLPYPLWWQKEHGGDRRGAAERALLESPS